MVPALSLRFILRRVPYIVSDNGSFPRLIDTVF
jgi:hypothetical protein